MTRPGLARFVAGLTLLALIIAACGVPKDGEPRTLPEDGVPFDLMAANTTAPQVDPGGTRTASLFFIHDNRLVERTRDNLPDASLTTVLNSLLLGSDEGEKAQGIDSAIQPGTRLLAVPTVDEATQVAIVDLSGEITAIQGPLLIQAFAEIVYTVTALPDIASVRFRVNGIDQPASTDIGETADPVNRSYYTSVAPLPPPQAPPTTS